MIYCSSVKGQESVLNVSTITLNVNGIDSVIERHRLVDWGVCVCTRACANFTASRVSVCGWQEGSLFNMTQ